MQKITTFLTFNNQAEEAANFYISLFKNSKIVSIYRNEGQGPVPEGAALNIAFQLDGQDFMAMDGGPAFSFAPGTSLFVNCANQEEVDDLWEKLSDGGQVQGCGWVSDRYGISWQIIPSALGELMSGPDAKKSQSVMQAMLQMNKIDIKTLQEAYDQA